MARTRVKPSSDTPPAQPGDVPPSFEAVPPPRKVRVAPLDAKAREAHARELEPEIAPVTSGQSAPEGAAVQPAAAPSPAPEPLPTAEIERHVARVCRAVLFGAVLLRRSRGEALAELAPMIEAVPAAAEEFARDFGAELAHYPVAHRPLRILGGIATLAAPVLRALAARPEPEGPRA